MTRIRSYTFTFFIDASLICFDEVIIFEKKRIFWAGCSVDGKRQMCSLGCCSNRMTRDCKLSLNESSFRRFRRYNKRFHFIFDKWTGSKWIVSWYKRSFRFLWRKHQGLNWRRKRFSRGLYEVQETYFPDSTTDCYQQFKRYCSLVINFINDQWFKNKFSWKFRNQFNLEYKNRRTEYGWDPPDGMNKWRGIMEHFHLTI